VNTVCF